jgi:hypothetical protein
MRAPRVDVPPVSDDLDTRGEGRTRRETVVMSREGRLLRVRENRGSVRERWFLGPDLARHDLNQVFARPRRSRSRPGAERIQIDRSSGSRRDSGQGIPP